MTFVCAFLAIGAGGMAFFQSAARDVAKKRDTEVAQVTAVHFRLMTILYGAISVLAVVAAITSSSLAFGFALVGLVAVPVSRITFDARRGRLIRRLRADRTVPE